MSGSTGTYFSGLAAASSVGTSDNILLLKASPSPGPGSGTVYKVTASLLFNGVTVALTQLSQSGAATGQVPQWNGSAWVPVSSTITLASLQALLATAPTTLPGTTGVLWVNGGIVQLS